MDSHLVVAGVHTFRLRQSYTEAVQQTVSRANGVGAKAAND